MSIGGSLLVPNGGVDYDFLDKLNQFIRKQVTKGHRFFLVSGGGALARQYRDAGKKVIGDIAEEDLDWLGIHATRLNAHLLRTVFQDIAHPRIIENYDKKLKGWREPVVIGAGWKPGWSTDYDAVILARDYGANLILNLSNIDWIYDKDPNIYKDAQAIKKLTWEEMEELVGLEWKPGIHAPFDPVAAQLAKRLHLTVIVTNGEDFKNLEKIIEGENFKGTVILPFKLDASFYDREYYMGKKGGFVYKRSKSLWGRISKFLSNYYKALTIKFFLKPKTVLDVGCGTGQLVKQLRVLGIDAYGVEISKDALEMADSDIKPFLKKGDIIDIPYKNNEFDLVMTFDVLEHVERAKIRRAIEETIRVSKKYIFHKVYTRENLWIRWFHGHDMSHISIFSKRRWMKFFMQCANITILRGLFFRLPEFFETIFLIRKKE